LDPAAADPLRPLPDHLRAPGLHAGFWLRVVAWFIDTAVLTVIHWVLVLFFGTWLLVPWALMGGAHGALMARFFDTGLQPFGIVVGWLYFALCESSRWQATPGKMALNLAVADDYGRPIGFGRATGRYFGKFVSALILCIGFLLAAWTARKQALHDLMAGCCVVRRAGLAAWQGERESRSDAAMPSALSSRAGMPGWAIALIVLGVGVFLVLPVTAILAAIAVPAYRNYTVRAEVAEGIQLTGRPRALIGEYIGERGALPESNGDLGLPKPEAIHARYVSSVRVTGGRVVVTYGNQADISINGGHVVIAPVGNARMLQWHCSSPDIQAVYLPSNCRE